MFFNNDDNDKLLSSYQSIGSYNTKIVAKYENKLIKGYINLLTLKLIHVIANWMSR